MEGLELDTFNVDIVLIDLHQVQMAHILAWQLHVSMTTMSVHKATQLWPVLVVWNYRISSKSHRTSKSCCPWNVAAYFSTLILINAALEISPQVKGRQWYAYVHTNRLIIEAVYTHARVDLCRHHPRNLAPLELSRHQTGFWNKISLRRDFKEIRYIMFCTTCLNGLQVRIKENPASLTNCC